MFFGFNTAVRGLTASKRALYTTGHNMDNMSTPGYSRQIAEQGATRAHRLPGIGYIGTGTEITEVTRARDAFVDYKYWNNMSPTGEWNIKNESLSELEKLMGEPTDSSFRQHLDDFYTSLDELSKNVKDPAFREPVRENAKSFAMHITDIGKKMDNQKKDTMINLGNKVSQVNQIAGQIESLNKQIYSQENTGMHANDLRDRRDLLIDQLSEIVDIRVSESPEGHHDISIGGNSLVNHINSSEIKLTNDNKILWDNESQVKIDSGELKGLIDIISGDGKENPYRGIPFYENQLNHFAKNFADVINTQHAKGFKLDRGPGGKFFDYDKDDNAALTLKVSDEILASVDNIAAGGTSGAAEDNKNLLELIQLREARDFFGREIEGGLEKDFPIGTPDDFIKSMLSSLAVDTMQTGRFKTTQELLGRNLENKRESISGVSLNDEMADMVKFQKVYVAASKMVTTYDTLLEVTINRLGLVGR